jgi:NADPH:quinone reductase-like Zn-dependent oxidoreductase
MPRAVRLHEYGDVDVLRVEEVDPPTPRAGEVVVRVRAAGINPGEAKIRSGALHAMFPASFPSGQGSDLAGVVEAVGDGVDASPSATRCWAGRTSAPARPSSCAFPPLS